MNRVEMIKWLSENTTREQWSNRLVGCVPAGCDWGILPTPTDEPVTLSWLIAPNHFITVEDVFGEMMNRDTMIKPAPTLSPEQSTTQSPGNTQTLPEYVTAITRFLKTNLSVGQWGEWISDQMKNEGWEYTTDNELINNKFQLLIKKEDIFGYPEHPLTPGPIQAPDTDTLYWDKHNEKYCYIVGSAWNDDALFFAEEFVDGDVTGNYFATERMNLVNGDKRVSIIDIVNEVTSGNISYCNRAVIADRILSEVIDVS